MKTLLAIVALLNLAGGLYLIFTGETALGASALGGALFAGTAHAILERLDTIAAHLAKPATPAAPLPKLSPPAYTNADFDTAKAVEAMREAQRLGRS